MSLLDDMLESCDDSCDSSLPVPDISNIFDQPCAPCAVVPNEYGGPVPASRRIDTTAPLFGGGDFSVDRTHFMPPATDEQDGYMTKEDHQLLGLIGGGGEDSRIISGSVTWSGTGLIFDWTDFLYIILGVPDSSTATQHTAAAAHATLPRIDTFYVGVGGTTGIITGTPDANPVKPQVDPATQLEAGFALIPAAATVPGGIFNTIIYDENTESTYTSTLGATNPAYATNPQHGTLNLRFPTMTGGNNFKFVIPTGIDMNTIQFIKFGIYLTNAWNNSTFLSFATYSGVTQTSSLLPINNGAFGFNRTIINAWQQITIPVSSLPMLADALVNTFYFRMQGTNNNPFQFDYLYVQGGNTNTQPSGVLSFNTRTGHVVSVAGDYVQRVANFAALPVAGNAAKAYITSDTKFIYHWNGATYDQVGGGSSLFLGVYTSLVNLQAAHPTASLGEYAQVDAGPGTDTINYTWDADEGWIAGSGPGMIYPGAGIPISTGVAWGSSITNNSTNWNTAFGWGNHAGLYSLLGHTHAAADIVSGILAVARGGTGIGSYTIGDLLYASSSSVLSVLGVGSNGQVLTLAGGLPTWAAAGGGGWGLTGNAGTTAGTNFIGTTDNIDVVFKRNSIESFRLGATQTDFALDARVGGGSGFVLSGGSGSPYIKGLGTPGVVLKDHLDNKRIVFSSAGISMNPDDNVPILFNRSTLQSNYSQSGGNQTILLSGTNLVGHLVPFFDIKATGYAGSTNTLLRLYTDNTTSGIYGNIIIAHNGTITTGRVGFGTSTPAASALVDISSTTLGFLKPRMTTIQRNAIASPATGLEVYDTDLGHTYWYNGSSWSQGSSPWVVSGSTIYYNAGNVGINNSSPTSKLSINTTATTTPPDTDGITLENTDPATSGVTGKTSGPLVFKSQSWYTAGSVSQNHKWKLDALPFGSGNSAFRISLSTNGGAYAILATLSHTGALSTAGLISTGGNSLASTTFSGAATNSQNYTGGFSQTFTPFSAIGTLANAHAINTISLNSFNSTPTVTVTGAGGSLLRGFYHAPILGAIVNVVHRAIETVTGDVIFGSTSGSVVIGSTTVEASAAFSIISTTKGALLPVMTSAQRTAISSPANALLVYDTDISGFMHYDTGSTTWNRVGLKRLINVISSTTSGASVVDTDYVYLCTSTFTYTQPTAVGNKNRYSIKNKGAGVITINFTGAETGEGSGSIVLNPGDAVALISDNSNWFII